MKQHSLGEAFSNLGPFLKLYSTYSSNYQTALSTLEVYPIFHELIISIFDRNG